MTAWLLICAQDRPAADDGIHIILWPPQEVTTPMANFSAIRNPEAGLGGNVLQEGCQNSVLMAVSGTVAATAPG